VCISGPVDLILRPGAGFAVAKSLLLNPFFRKLYQLDIKVCPPSV